MNAPRLLFASLLLFAAPVASASDADAGGTLVVKVAARTSDAMPDALIRTARALKSVDGVEKVEIRNLRGEVRARFQPEKITEDQLLAAIDAAGLHATAVGSPRVAKGNEADVTR